MESSTTELFNTLKPLGAVLNPDLVQATYAVMTPHCARLDPALCRAAYDLSYAEHPRHLLDIYMPTTHETPQAVIVYVHGGGFAGGDKGGRDKPFFANIGAWATGAGLAAVSMSYRLVPEARWPSGAEDVAQAVAWLSANADEHLGGARKIILAGQSAGAINVADYLAGRAGAVNPHVVGAILISGVYDFTRHERLPFEAAYFGSDTSRRGDQSTLEALINLDLPLLFTVSELDPPPFHQQAAHIVEANVRNKGVWPRMHYLAEHNHVSPALHIGADGDRLGPMLMVFIKGLLG